MVGRHLRKLDIRRLKDRIKVRRKRSDVPSSLSYRTAHSGKPEIRPETILELFRRFSAKRKWKALLAKFRNRRRLSLRQIVPICVSLADRLRRLAICNSEGNENINSRVEDETSLSSSAPSQGPQQESVPVSPFDVVQFVPDGTPDTIPEPAYLSLSSDLRLLPVRQNEDPPSSLLSFRRHMLCLELTRMKDVPRGVDPAQTPLPDIIAPRVSRVMHEHGPAIRIFEDGKIIQLIAKDDKERDKWMSAIALRLAPLSAIRCRFKAEIRSANSASNGCVSVSEAAKEVVRLDTECGNKHDSGEGRYVSLAKRVWTSLGTAAQSLNWTSHFGQAIAGSAKDVEKLAQPFCQIGVVGCVFSLVSLSARAAHLLATEYNGKEKLEDARKSLREASLALCEWLIQILATGCQDENLIDKVFEVMEDCWDAAARVENYVLKKWIRRVWKAEKVKDIEENVKLLRNRLLSVGVLKHVAIEIEGVKKRVDALEQGVDGKEVFRSFFPDPVQFAAGLLPDAAQTTIDHIKEHVFLSRPSSSSASHVGNQDNDVPRVAIISISGEGGVGKTSACKLICADRDIQNHFPVVQF